MATKSLWPLTIILLMNILHLKIVNPMQNILEHMSLQEQKLYLDELMQIREARKQIRIVRQKDLCQSRWLSVRPERRSRAQHNCITAYNYFVTLPAEDRANCINPDLPDCRRHPNYDRKVCTFMCDIPEELQGPGCWPFDCRTTAEPRPLGFITVKFGIDPVWLDQYEDPTCWYTAGRGPAQRVNSPAQPSDQPAQRPPRGDSDVNSKAEEYIHSNDPDWAGDRRGPSQRVNPPARPSNHPVQRLPSKGDSDVDSKAEEYIHSHHPMFGRATRTPSPVRRGRLRRADTDIDFKSEMFIATAHSKMDMQNLEKSRTKRWQKLRAPLRLLSNLRNGL